MSEAKDYSDAIDAFANLLIEQAEGNVSELQRLATGRWFEEELILLCDVTGSAGVSQCIDAVVARIDAELRRVEQERTSND